MKWSKAVPKDACCCRLLAVYGSSHEKHLDGKNRLRARPTDMVYSRELKTQVFPYYSISCDLLYCTWPQLQENCY